MESQRSIRFIKDDWIRRQMKDCEGDFINTIPLRIFVGTFNANGKKISSPLEPWLSWPVVGRNPSQSDAQKVIIPDIYVCGFQEIVDLNVQNAVSETGTRERSNAWIDMMKETLNIMAKRYAAASGSTDDGLYYEVVTHKYLVGIMICVFVLRKHLPYIKSVQTSNAPTGVMGVVGNKGGSAIRLNIYDSSICFVCAHLAAHRENVDGRNSDFASINLKSLFKYEPPSTPGSQKSVPEYHHPRIASHGLDVIAKGTLAISDHDIVIWLGDFNYRIDAQYSDELVFDYIDRNDLNWLLANDQLNIERRAGRVFRGFIEPQITFFPTYKYQVNTDNYDRRPEKKVRAPAWCDRVLYKGAPIDRSIPNAPLKENQLIARDYNRVNEIRFSDHKPVYAIFDAVARSVVDEQRNRSYENVLRALNKYEPNQVPDVQLDSSNIQFPNVYYRESVVKEVTIVNNGGAPAVWRFARRPDGLISHPWFTIAPLFGMLIPGESLRIRITCFVGATSARKLLDGSRRLDDLIILRVENSDDQFMCLTGELTPTCFGADLLSLVSIPHALRGCSKEDRDKLIAKIGPNPPPLYVPKELWHLLDHLYQTGGLKTYGLLHVPGDPDEMRIVRQCIDAELQIPSDRCSAHSVGAVILEFLDALAVPVVPPDYFPKGIDFDNLTPELQGWSSRFFKQLPSVNHNVLVYIIAFARDLLARENAQHNQLTARSLSAVLARILFRPDIVAEVAREKSSTSGVVGEFSNWLMGDTGMAKESSTTSIAESAVYHLLTIDQRYLL